MFKLKLVISIKGTNTLLIITQLKLYIIIVILALFKSKGGEVLKIVKADKEVLNLFKSNTLDQEPYFLFLSRFLYYLLNSFLRYKYLRKHLASI